MMEGHQPRGRSSSAGRIPNHNINHSPSPHGYREHTSRLGSDPTIGSTSFNPGVFSHENSSPSGPIDFNLSGQYFDASSQPGGLPKPPIVPSNDYSEQELGHAYTQDSLGADLQHLPQHLDLQNPGDHFNSDLLDSDAPNTFGGFSQQDFGGEHSQTLENGFGLDLSTANMQMQHQSINPQDIMSSNLSSPQNLMPTPPLFLADSDQTSPTSNQPSRFSPGHSRHTSLDPNAAYGNEQTQTGWQGVLGAQFQGHRRAPSEHSDVSSSVAPSPYMQSDTFEPFDQRSPLMPPQDPQVYQDLRMEQFSLSEAQQPSQHKISPRHSPYPSPRLTPQAGLGLPQDAFQFSNGLQNNYTNGPSETFAGQQENFSQQDTFPQFHNGRHDMGQAQQMETPQINVEPAPAGPQNYEPLVKVENGVDTLSPPGRGTFHLCIPYPSHAKLPYRSSRSYARQVRNLHLTPRHALFTLV